jgi:putative NADPH-quinone reductase
MDVFLVSNYPDNSFFYQTLLQITAAVFARTGYEVSMSSLNADYEQAVYNSKPKAFIKDNIRLQSDRHKIIAADKIILQLMIGSQNVQQTLENWFEKVFDAGFIHSYANILSGKTALIILSQAKAGALQEDYTLSQKVLLEYLVNKYLRVADIKVMPTHITLTDTPASRQRERNYIQQYSKKIRFYALLLSSSIYSAG